MDALVAGEPLAGTAAIASAWIIIEQPGPWGRDALSDSPLDPRVAEHLAEAGRSGVSVLLARHPDRPARNAHPERHVWVARSLAGGFLQRHGVLDSLAELATWDVAAIGAGQLPAIGKVDPLPTTFVCTHSKRDRCCALEGRALITDLLAACSTDERTRIWECSHMGGHRFSPCMLTLPSGAVHGRIDVAEAREVIQRSRSHEVVVDRLRGLSGFVPPFQVAAIAVMRAEGITRDDQLDVLRVVDGRVVPGRPGRSPDDHGATIEADVRHVDGRAWRAVLAQTPLAGERRESCAKQPVPGFAWECSSLSPSAPWS